MIAADAGMNFSFNRVAAMVRRYWYLLRSSWPRVLDLIYWPAVQMLMWGFLQVYISQNAGFFARAGGVFIGSVLLWDILFRGQLGFSISFLEEMYARNLGNIMMSPLRPAEFLLALMVMSTVRLSIGMVPVSFLAIAFFGFNLWALGLALVAFFVNLILTSWSVGIFVAGLLLRNGLGAEKHGLDHHVSLLAAHLCLLSGRCVAGVATIFSLGIAADLCVRRNARAGDGPRVSRRSDGASFRVQHRAVRGCIICFLEAFAERAGPRLTIADQRIAGNALYFMALQDSAALYT